MTQLSTIIISYGQYKTTPPLASENEVVPKNIRLFYYNFKEVDYDNYYLLQIYKKIPKILFFVNKNNGKMFKKEFQHKEFSPGEKIPKGIVLSFNNIKHMMDTSSLIIHPNGFQQDFHNNGKHDSFVITLAELLNQLSSSYNKLFPDEVVEVHLSSHKNNGNAEYTTKRKLILYDSPDNFTIEEKQNMENMLLREFIVVNEYPQAKYISSLARKKTPLHSIINKTRTFFSKYRKIDPQLKTHTL